MQCAKGCVSLLVPGYIAVVCAVVCICSKAKTRGPRAEHRFRWARRAAHTRRGYSCYIYGMQTRGADRAGADARGGQVECRGVGGRSCLEFLLCGEGVRKLINS